MIRWLQKQDGSRVLQEKHPSPMFPEWYDVPTEVEQLPYLTAEEFIGEMARISAKPEPRKPREWWVRDFIVKDYMVDTAYKVEKPLDGDTWIKVREILDDER